MHASAETPVSFEGPAFTNAAKSLAGVLMAGLVVYGAQVLPLFIDKRSTWGAMLFILLALVFIAASFIAMVRSRTRIDATHIEQSWISRKRVAVADITQVKLIYIPGLVWLIAPRLIVKTRRPGSIVFHTADPMVLAAFARLSLGQAPMPS